MTSQQELEDLRRQARSFAARNPQLMYILCIVLLCGWIGAELRIW